MKDSQTGFIDLRMIIGLAVVFLGIALLIDNIDPDLGLAIWRWWPAFLILIGLRVLIQPAEHRQQLTGTIIVLIGLLLLLNNFDLIALHWSIMWPAILVLVGLAIIFRSIWGSRKGALSKEYVNLNMILGGGEFRYDSPDFRGGKVTAIMGGGALDLRDVKPIADEITIDAMTIMGGLEIRVPVGWKVIMEGTPILGGIEDKTISHETGQAANGKRLIIKGMTIMGGLEVKN